MRYVVFVEMLDGTGRIDLANTTDQPAAAEMVNGLTKAASGDGFIAGIAIQPEPPERPAPEAKAGQPQHQQQHQPAPTQRGTRPAMTPQSP